MGTATSACGVEWPVCPDCAGEGLSTSAGVSRCPKCARRWSASERVPCPDAATVALADATGVHQRVCRSHAAHPSASRIGGTG